MKVSFFSRRRAFESYHGLRLTSAISVSRSVAEGMPILSRDRVAREHVILVVRLDVAATTKFRFCKERVGAVLWFIGGSRFFSRATLEVYYRSFTPLLKVE